MKPMILAAFATCLGLTACARMQAERPEGFSVTLVWDTGALPPPYHYSFTIAIGPGLTGNFSYQPGYASESNNELWETKFEIGDADLDALYQTLTEKGMLRSKWATGQPLLGGRGTSLVITFGNEEYEIPSISILASQERKKVEEVIKIIRGLVPRSIWDEMDTRQAEFEAGFEY